MNNTYYAPKPMKFNNGLYRATDTEKRIAYGYTEEEALAGLNDNITSDAEAMQRITDKQGMV
jgi:hypothetical protein